MEIFTLEISFPYDSGDEPWIRVIEVKEDFTLEQLHYYIQEIVAFDNDHLYEFYIGKNTRNKSGAISEHTYLNEIYPMTGFKLYYLFDYGDNWLFQIKKSRKRVVEDVKVEYPRVVKSMGVSPEQYPEYEE
ncbi:MAG: plasmid pRiA4b ORF-3 family protein [Colwellia sp.]|nr:plasmid pRiA4b ORF-3 family protein [Colwellia sp.]